jgi:hypothetical protein
MLPLYRLAWIIPFKHLPTIWLTFNVSVSRIVNCQSVVRRHCHSEVLVNLCINFIFCCAFSNVSLADTAKFYTGTYYSFIVDDKYIAASIDSRVTASSKPNGTGDVIFVDDKYCKIVILGDTNFAYFVGNDYVINNGSIALDVKNMATRAYQSIMNYSKEPDAIAQKFLYIASEELDKVYFIDKTMTLPPEGQYGTGYFFGIDRDGSVAADFTEIDFNNGHFYFRFRKQGVAAEPFRRSIKADVFDEMFSQSTPRSKQLNANIGASHGAQTEADKAALRVTGYVQAMINWGNEPGIGGDATTVILERGQTLRWYIRPDFCPEK